jgi:RNA polymerase-binding transcription factor DksA
MEAILNTEAYEQRLQAEEQLLLNSIDRADTNARNLSEGPSVREWGDTSVRDEGKTGQFPEADIDSTTLTQVRAALTRIEQGTFGKCLVDGGPIEEKRLHAMPWTPYCEEEQSTLSTGTPADCADALAVSGDLFGAAPKPTRKAKTTKPIKRVFNIPSPRLIGFGGNQGERLKVCSIRPLPCVPNAGEANGPGLVAQILDRLALILHPRDYDRWLGIDDRGGDPRPPLDLLHPNDANKMVMKLANPAVGNWQ